MLPAPRLGIIDPGAATLVVFPRWLTATCENARSPTGHLASAASKIIFCWLSGEASPTQAFWNQYREQVQILAWDGHALVLGPPRTEQVVVGAGGQSLAPTLAVGDWCALHWDWVCARLTDGQAANLRAWTLQSLVTVNGTTAPAPASVLS